MPLVIVFCLGMLWGVYEFFRGLKRQKKQEETLRTLEQLRQHGHDLVDQIRNLLTDAQTARQRKDDAIQNELAWLRLANGYGHDLLTPELQYEFDRLHAQHRQVQQKFTLLENAAYQYQSEVTDLHIHLSPAETDLPLGRLQELEETHARLLEEFTSQIRELDDMIARLGDYRKNISLERLKDPAPLSSECSARDPRSVEKAALRASRAMLESCGLLDDDDELDDDLDLFDDDDDFPDEDDDLLF